MKKSELEKEITEIWFSLLESKRYYLYAKYLFSPETADERLFISGNIDLQVIRTAIWRYSVIELSKLFKESKNEKYNIYKLINNLRPGNKYGSQKLDVSIIENWEDLLGGHKQLLSEISTMRDKAFAHSELGYIESLKYNSLLTEVEDLFKICETIITDVFENVLNASPYHDPKHSSNNLSKILKVLVEDDKQQDRRNEEIFKNLTRK